MREEKANPWDATPDINTVRNSKFVEGNQEGFSALQVAVINAELGDMSDQSEEERRGKYTAWVIANSGRYRELVEGNPSIISRFQDKDESVRSAAIAEVREHLHGQVN